MSDIVLERKVHRLERPWVNALYAECGCMAAINARHLTSSTQVHTLFLTYFSVKDLDLGTVSLIVCDFKKFAS